MDLRDGIVRVRVLGQAVATDLVTPPGQPIKVIYEAVDAAGNVARRQRLITVVDDCTQLGEFRCRETLLCSAFRSCDMALMEAVGLRGANASGPDSAGGRSSITATMAHTVQQTVERPPDDIPPMICVIGTGQLYTTDTGATGMIDTVYVGDTYIDAGATALDIVPAGAGAAPVILDITADIMTRIRSPGGAVVSSVSTDVPTGTETTGGLPYIVSYDVVDGAGNRTATVYRRVYVLCRPPEFECPVGGTGNGGEQRACSAGGICGSVMPPPAATALMGLTTTTATTDAGFSASTVVLGSVGSGNSKWTASSGGGSSGMPRLTLNSLPRLVIRRGAAYVPCRGEVLEECDPGATATLHTTGDLDSQVRACAAGVTDPQPFDMVGLQYCNINTQTPGVYAISFHLTWPSFRELVVYRTLVVEDECVGERVCTDGSCSRDGWCAADVPLASGGDDDPGQSSGSRQETGAGGAQPASFAGGMAASSYSNTPPRLNLATRGALGLQVSVPRGVPYERCTAGQVPTAEVPCELLGYAEDSEDGDLTPAITLCPPSDCAKTQCRAHWADRKQPSECGVDTVNAPIGSTFRLLLVVFDSAGENATAERVVTVASPCADGQFACQEPSGRGSASYTIVCSNVACDSRQKLSSIGRGAASTLVVGSSYNGTGAAVRPRLFLLPGLHASNLSQAEANQTVILAYMRPAPVSLAPCASFLEGLGLPHQTASCAAIANSSTGGDLTPEISTSVQRLCPEGVACSGCTVASLTLGGCLPGHYRVNYTVSEGVGARSSLTSLQLDVYVEQLTWQVFNLSLFSNGTAARSTDRAAAEAFATALTANESVRLEALSTILKALGVASGSIRSIALLSPPVVEASVFAPTNGAGAVAATPPSVPHVYTVRVMTNVTTGTADVKNSQDAMPPSISYSSSSPALAPTRTGYLQQFDLPSKLPGHTAGQPLHDTDWSRLFHRRTLQQASSNCLNIPVGFNVSSSAAASYGLASVEANNSTCRSPAPEQFSVLLSLLIGAIADPEVQTQQALGDLLTSEALVAGLDDKFTAADEVYREEAVAMSTEASRALESVYAKAAELLALEEATLDQQSINSFALGTALDLMQATLNEARAAESRSRISSAGLLEGLGLGLGNTSGDGAESQYADCIFARGSGAFFAFSIASYSSQSDITSATPDITNASGGGSGTSSSGGGGGGSSSITARRRLQRHGAIRSTGPGSERLPAETDALQAQRLSPSRRMWTVLSGAVCRWLLPLKVKALLCGAKGPSTADPGPPEAVEAASAAALPVDATHHAGQQQRPVQEQIEHQGRSLTAFGGGGGGGSDSSRMIFDGYSLPSGQGYDYSLWETRNRARSRSVGLENRVLEGLVLHQVRRNKGATSPSVAVRDAANCRTSAFPHLVSGCSEAAAAAHAPSAGGSSTVTDSGSVSESAQRGGLLGGIGTDPVFSRFSSLYNDLLDPADWYNTSQGSPDLSPTGYPYGFFHEPLERFPPGYPVLFDTHLSAQRAEQAITFVRDGGYLSQTYTKSLRAQLVTYNSRAQVFGYWRVDFSWSDSGVIDAKAHLLGLPAISYGDSIARLQVSKFLPDFLLVLLVAAYCCMTGYDIVRQIQVQRQGRRLLSGRLSAAKLTGGGGSGSGSGGSGRRGNRVRPGRAGGHNKGYLDPEDDAFEDMYEDVEGNGRRKYTPRMSAKWVAYEATVCALMAAAVGVFYTYAVRLSVQDAFAARYDVYDADAYAPARFFLLRRRDGATAPTAAATAAAAAAPAGGPGRWRADADPQPLRDAFAMLSRLDDMYNTVVLYTFLQGLVLLAIVVRWLHYIAFQPRLSIVIGTLVLALPGLLHFALIIVICTIMFGAAASLGFGTSTHRLSDIGSSLNLMLQYVLSYDDGGVFKGLLSPVRHQSSAEWALAGLLYLLGPVFFQFVLSNFILAMLAWPFGELKYAVAKLPGVPQDMMRFLRWYWQRMARGAPKNKLLQRWLEAWLKEGTSRGFMYQVHKSFFTAVKAFRGASVSAPLGSPRSASSAASLRGVKAFQPSSALLANASSQALILSNALRTISRARLQLTPPDTSGAAVDSEARPGSGAANGAATLQQRIGLGNLGGSISDKTSTSAGAEAFRNWRRIAAAATGNQLQIDVHSDTDSAVVAAGSGSPCELPLASPLPVKATDESVSPFSAPLEVPFQGGALAPSHSAGVWKVVGVGGSSRAGSRSWRPSRLSVTSEGVLPHSLPEDEILEAGSSSRHLEVAASLPLPPPLEVLRDVPNTATARSLVLPRSSVDGPGGVAGRTRRFSYRSVQNVLMEVDQSGGGGGPRSLGRGGPAIDPVQSLRDSDAAALLADAVMANLMLRVGRSAGLLGQPASALGAAASPSGDGAADGSGGGVSTSPLGRGGVLVAARRRSQPVMSAGGQAADAIWHSMSCRRRGSAESIGLSGRLPGFRVAAAEMEAGAEAARAARQPRVKRRATFSFGTPLDASGVWAIRVQPPPQALEPRAGSGGGGGGRGLGPGHVNAIKDLDDPSAVGAGGGGDEEDAGDAEVQAEWHMPPGRSTRTPLLSFPMSSASAGPGAGGLAQSRLASLTGVPSTETYGWRHVGFTASQAGTTQRLRPRVDWPRILEAPVSPLLQGPLPSPSPTRAPPPCASTSASVLPSVQDRRLHTVLSSPAAADSGARRRSRLARSSSMLVVSPSHEGMGVYMGMPFPMAAASRCSSGVAWFAGVSPTDGSGRGNGGRAPLGSHDGPRLLGSPKPGSLQHVTWDQLQHPLPPASGGELLSAQWPGPTAAAGAAAVATATPSGGNSPRAAASLVVGNNEGDAGGGQKWWGGDAPAAVTGTRSYAGPVAEAVEDQTWLAAEWRAPVPSVTAATSAGGRGQGAESPGPGAGGQAQFVGGVAAPVGEELGRHSSSGGVWRYERIVEAVLALTAQLQVMQQQLLAALQEVQDMAELLAALVAAVEAIPGNMTDRRAVLWAALCRAARAYQQEHPAPSGRLSVARHTVLEEPVTPWDPRELLPTAWATSPLTDAVENNDDASAGAASRPPNFTAVREMPATHGPLSDCQTSLTGRENGVAHQARRPSSAGGGGGRPGSAIHHSQVELRQPAPASSPPAFPHGRAALHADQHSVLVSSHPDWNAVRRTLAATDPDTQVGGDAALLAAIVAASGSVEGPLAAVAAAGPQPLLAQQQQQQRRGWGARRRAMAVAAETGAAGADFTAKFTRVWGVAVRRAAEAAQRRVGGG